ncbi:unnamed protein product [Linum trigynum]|uniref:Uncharacterized protein n=1 Tax=Linum trigynum TaxID=586398 RepID=A0AAV2CF18_9ROSI
MAGGAPRGGDHNIPGDSKIEARERPKRGKNMAKSGGDAGFQWGLVDFSGEEFTGRNSLFIDEVEVTASLEE